MRTALHDCFKISARNALQREYDVAHVVGKRFGNAHGHVVVAGRGVGRAGVVDRARGAAVLPVARIRKGHGGAALPRPRNI